MDEERKLELEVVGLAEWAEDRFGVTWVSYGEVEVGAGVKLNTLVVNGGEGGFFAADEVLRIEVLDAGVYSLCIVVVKLDR